MLKVQGTNFQGKDFWNPENWFPIEIVPFGAEICRNAYSESWRITEGKLLGEERRHSSRVKEVYEEKLSLVPHLLQLSVG